MTSKKVNDLENAGGDVPYSRLPEPQSSMQQQPQAAPFYAGDGTVQQVPVAYYLPPDAAQQQQLQQQQLQQQQLQQQQLQQQQLQQQQYPQEYVTYPNGAVVPQVVGAPAPYSHPGAVPVAAAPAPPGAESVGIPVEQVAPTAPVRAASEPPTGRASGRFSYGEQDWKVDADKLLNADMDRKIRHGFIRKVYGILSVQLFITFGIALAFNLSTTLADWSYYNWWLFIVLAIVMMATVCTLICVPGMGRKVPWNYALLSLITVCMGFVLGYATATVDTWAFSMAAGITAAVVVALTLFAFQTKWDFTGCGSYAFVALLILMIFGFVACFTTNYIVDMVYGSLGAMVFSFYLVFDTQRIVGGKHHKFQYSIDDYCFAALSLYLDVINLFTYILTIIAAADH